MATVKIAKSLQKYINNLPEVTIDCDSYFNFYNNLLNLFPDLRKIHREVATNKILDFWILVDKRPLRYEELFLPVKKGAEIVIVPMIGGGGDTFAMIAIGIAVIALSVVLMNPAVGFGLAASLAGGAGLGAVFATAGVISSLSTALLSVGLGIVLSGVMGLVNPKNKKNSVNDSNIRSDNDAFGSLENTTSTETPIPLIFGQMRVPGQLVAGRIKTINHDATTVISVANYV